MTEIEQTAFMNGFFIGLISIVIVVIIIILIWYRGNEYENDWGVMLVARNGELFSREETGNHKIAPEHEFNIEKDEDKDAEYKKRDSYFAQRCRG